MRQQGKLIGLTGGIGAGKSTVAEILRQNGIPVIDADQVAHSCYLPGSPGQAAIVGAFGPEILKADGHTDRKGLGRLVFSDPSLMKKLTAIIWPETEKKIHAAIEGERSIDPLCPVVVEAAILIEAGWHRFVDEVWLVTSSEATVQKRLTEIRGLSLSEINKRLDSQMPPSQKVAFAHRIIENDVSPEILKEKVNLLLPGLWKTPDI